MALFGSAISGEVGLRLLLCPFPSNIVIRTACCTVGIALPVYSTFKALEKKDTSEQEKWLLYWAVYGSFSLAEVFSDRILSWCPLYYHMKFAFLVWLQLPSADGSTHLYTRYLRPFLLKHHARLEQLLGLVSGEATRFVSAHQGEIQLLRNLLRRSITSAFQMMRDIFQPMRGHRAIQDKREIQGSESEDD